MKFHNMEKNLKPLCHFLKPFYNGFDIYFFTPYSQNVEFVNIYLEICIRYRHICIIHFLKPFQIDLKCFSESVHRVKSLNVEICILYASCFNFNLNN